MQCRNVRHKTKQAEIDIIQSLVWEMAFQSMRWLTSGGEGNRMLLVRDTRFAMFTMQQ